MSGQREVTYALDFGASRGERPAAASERKLAGGETGEAISRIARLMALAIRFEGLSREGTMRDSAELALRSCRA